jgi:uncharacterized membrane protein
VAHFDLIHKFARGTWPGRSDLSFDPEVVDVWILDGTFEYLNRPGTLWVGVDYPPPVRDWKRSVRDQQIQSQRDSPGLGRLINHEAHEPPVYYAVAAVWHECGRALGLSPASTVYWVRFLNVLLFPALVALAYRFCEPYFGPPVALAVAALTAFFPNTVYFTINADVLSPLAVLLALFFLLRWYEHERPGPWLAAGAGLLTAAAVLVKMTNTAILGIAAALVVLRLWRDRQPARVLAVAWPLALAATLPPFLWGLRNRLVLGEWTGTTAKTLAQNWTPKETFGELLDHPLFTPGGLPAFLKALCISFFRGDASWHGEVFHFPPTEIFFLVTVPVFVTGGLVIALRRGSQEPRARLAAGIAALLIVTYLAELLALSLRWDFGDNPYPSRAFPFFAFGRIVGGALVPLLALYAYGIEALVGRRPRWLAAATAVPIVMMVLGQVAYVMGTTDSLFNWFHLP